MPAAKPPARHRPGAGLPRWEMCLALYRRPNIASFPMTRRTRLAIEALDDRCLPTSPAVNYGVSPNPRAVATADFNNDQVWTSQSQANLAAR